MNSHLQYSGIRGAHWSNSAKFLEQCMIGVRLFVERLIAKWTHQYFFQNANRHFVEM